MTNEREKVDDYGIKDGSTNLLVSHQTILCEQLMSDTG